MPLADAPGSIDIVVAQAKSFTSHVTHEYV